MSPLADEISGEGHSSPSGEAPRVVDNPLPEIKPDDGNIQG